MLRRMEDAHSALATRSEAALKILGALTDESLQRRVADDHRSLAGMAWHVVTSMPEMMNRTGLGVSSVDPESSPPRDAASIVDGYRKVSAELRERLKAWSDADLEIADDMYGEKWQRGLTLAILIQHEIHHLGQMTVLMRQAGLAVPGVFGPAKEEWTAYGMPEPPY